MTEQIDITTQDGILRIAFNRPEKKNAILPDMYRSLADAFERFEKDNKLRVLLLEGRGDTFTAGNDMASFFAPEPDDLDSFPTFRLMMAAARCDKPLVAAVNGPAVGIGVTLLLHFDFILAAEGATFQTPFVNLGAVPEAGSSQLFPAAIGWRGAAEFLIAGDRMTAARAEQLGLINRVVSPGALTDQALAVARRIAERPPEAVRQTKRLMKGDHMPGMEALMREEMMKFGERIKSAEMQEAVSAFLQKRKPDFSKLG